MSNNVVSLAAFARTKGVRLQNDLSPEAALLPRNSMTREEAAYVERKRSIPVEYTPQSTPTSVAVRSSYPNERRQRIPPKDQMTELHDINGYKSRREYFWKMSQLYQIPVEDIQAVAFDLGVEEDFGRLVQWMRSRDPNRNR